MVCRVLYRLLPKIMSTIGPRCHVMCVERESGDFLWGIDIEKDYLNETPLWYTGQCPIIDNGIAVIEYENDIRATIHSNRKLPLLNEFPLKPGRFTMARFSKGHGKSRLVLGGGEMLKAPLAFSGTAGVARLDSPVTDVLENLMAAGLEHHTAIVYGEHRPSLRYLAKLMALEVVDLTR